ncbi:MAG: hypothetical protein QNJ73_08420, partial [Gammaproteobacteria bacterium]|nr:hypothetical protein [Gammaproteobacteria bacterium]
HAAQHGHDHAELDQLRITEVLAQALVQARRQLTEAELDALPDYEHGPFTPAERAALALADEMSLTKPLGQLTPGLYERLRQHFSDAELIELGMIMAVLCGMAKFLFVFDLVEKEDSCPFQPAGQKPVDQKPVDQKKS